MSYVLDIQTTYRTILAAARERRLVSYTDIADAQGKRISRVRDELIRQLDEILCISRRRGWPALTAIVVNQNADGLEGAALEGFAKSAALAGYEVGDPREFADEQKWAVFATAPTTPEVLDMEYGAVREDRGTAIGDAEGAKASEAQRHAAKPGLEARVTAVETKVEGLQENAGELREDFREFRAETSANFNRLEDKMDANHRECMSKIDSSNSELLKKIDSSSNQLHSRIDRSNSELHSRIDNSNSDLLKKIDSSNSERHSRIDNSNSELLKKIDSNHAEVLKKLDERSEKLFDRRLLVHLAIIGAVVTIVVSVIGMPSP